ncbi:hypothetical protein Tco_1361305 [Tanacetum coccineum]
MERIRIGRNIEGNGPSEARAEENGRREMNLPPLLAAHLGRNEDGQPPRSSLTSVHGGRQSSINTGGNLLPMFTASNKEKARVSELSPLGLMEKTYTWIEAREVATNEALNDRRDNFERSRKSSWDNGRGQRSRDRFSPYRGPNHRLLSSLSKSPREILATEKVARSFEQPHRMLGNRRSRDMSKFCYFHKDHGHDTNVCRQLRSQIEEAARSGQLSHLVKWIKKERKKTSDSQRGEKKEKNTTPAEAPILMINREEARTRNNISKSPTFEGREITFLLVTKGSNSSAPVIIKAKIFGREVGRIHMESDSSCEVIYRHCFLKLKPYIQASKVDSQVSLVGFSREKKDNNAENGDGSLHDPRGRQIPHHPRNRNCVLNPDKIEGVKKVRETSPTNTEGVLSCTDAEEKIIVNNKYPEQTVTIGKQLPEHFKERTITNNGKPFNTEHKLNEYGHIKPIKQKRRSLGPDRSTTTHKEVVELTRAGILREGVHQTWVANPVMVKKSDRG